MQVSKKVLVTDSVHPLLLQGLEQAGYVCVYEPKISLTDVLPIIDQYHGIVINSKIIVDQVFLDTAVQLEFVARLGSGLEIIDLPYAAAKGVQVHRAPDGNCDAVAEQAIGMLLSLANNLRQADKQVREGVWQREANRGWELQGKTIGIIGFGYTGQAFAKRLAGFGMQVLAYDKYKQNYATDYSHVQEVTMEQIWEQADIVSFHLPLTAETIGLATTAYWQKFAKPVVVINTARGAIIPTSVLLEQLGSGKISGACLDVFENEKPNTYTTEEKEAYQKLWQHPNIIVSPHIAGWTKESKQRLAELLLHRILNQ